MASDIVITKGDVYDGGEYFDMYEFKVCILLINIQYCY